MTIRLIKNLSGHSGCKIDLMHDGNMFFVRKASGECSYNQRLRTQIAKQIGYRSSENAPIVAPKVYRTGIIDGLFYCDMEYVESLTMASHIESITTKGIGAFIELVIKELHISDGLVLPGANDIFQQKIDSLSKNIPQREIYIKAMKRLERFDFSEVPYSKCHGDLTLENILLDVKGKVYLIDFLDSFFDSWMVDVAKLLQDLELQWSYRHCDISANVGLRLSVAKEKLIDCISRLPNGHEKVIQIYYILLLNIMRIVPYIKDDITERFIDNAILKLNNILDNKEQSL